MSSATPIVTVPSSSQPTSISSTVPVLKTYPLFSSGSELSSSPASSTSSVFSAVDYRSFKSGKSFSDLYPYDFLSSTYRSESSHFDEEDDEDDLDMPRTVGKYTLGDVLGEGDFATVFIAHPSHRTSDTSYAVKFFDRKMRNFSNSRIRTELRILQKLRSSSTKFAVPLVDFVETPSAIAIVTLRIKGPNLSDYVGNKPITESEAKFWFRQLCAAVSECHRSGVYHRDVKPSNVLLDVAAGRLYLADFGSATDRSDRFRRVSASLAGSPAVCPPEIACGSGGGRVFGQSIDIWAIGVCLYYMVTGSPPFAGKSVHQLLKNICKAEFHMPRTLTADLKDLLCKLLQRNPMKRITMEAVFRHPWLVKEQYTSLISASDILDGRLFLYSSFFSSQSSDSTADTIKRAALLASALDSSATQGLSASKSAMLEMAARGGECAIL